MIWKFLGWLLGTFFFSICAWFIIILLELAFTPAIDKEGKFAGLIPFLSLAIGMSLSYLFVSWKTRKYRKEDKEKEEQLRYQEEIWRTKDPQLVCPHCRTQGHVHRRQTVLGKQATCSNCGQTWSIQ